MSRIFILLILSISTTFAQKKFTNEIDFSLGFRKNFDTPRSKLITVGVMYPISLVDYNSQISPYLTFSSNLEISTINLGVTYDYYLSEEVKSWYLQAGFYLMFPNHSYRTLYPLSNAKIGIGYRFKNYNKLLLNLEGSVSEISPYADYAQLTYFKAIRFSKFKNNLSNKCPY